MAESAAGSRPTVLLSTASLSALGYEHNLSQPARGGKVGAPVGSPYSSSEVRKVGCAVAQLESALGDQMLLLEEPAPLPGRVFFIDRGEDEQLDAWLVADGPR
jgi:hypothetical protein